MRARRRPLGRRRAGFLAGVAHLRGWVVRSRARDEAPFGRQGGAFGRQGTPSDAFRCRGVPTRRHGANPARRGASGRVGPAPHRADQHSIRSPCHGVRAEQHAPDPGPDHRLDEHRHGRAVAVGLPRRVEHRAHRPTELLPPPHIEHRVEPSRQRGPLPVLLRRGRPHDEGARTVPGQLVPGAQQRRGLTRARLAVRVSRAVRDHEAGQHRQPRPGGAREIGRLGTGERGE